MNILFYAFLFFLPLLGMASETPLPIDPFQIDIKEEAPPIETNFMGEFITMLVMLSLLILAVFLTSHFLKRIVNARIESQNSTSAIKILERRALSQKTTLYLVDVDGEEHLILEGPTNASSINRREALKKIEDKG